MNDENQPDNKPPMAEQQSVPNQPVAPVQPVEAPQPQVIQQYVVTQKSLKGLGGMLIFWMIVFALVGIGYISIFAQIISGGDMSAPNVTAMVFSPFIAVASIASAALIAMQKKLAKLVSMATLGLFALFSTATSIVGFVAPDSSASSTASTNMVTLVSGLLISWLIYGLIAYYFVASRRVKETLVK